MGKQRDPFWDTLKGILIVLVVLGHTETALGDKWLSVIYAFHMPLFIFVSGYFSKRMPLREMSKVVKRLIVIYLVFNPTYITINVLMGEHLTVERLLIPAFALWYILSLIYWRVILQVIPQRVVEKRWLVILTSIAISIGAGFVPLTTEMSFQRACGFMPFFFIGYYARQYGWVDRLRLWNKIPFAVLFVALCALCYFLLPAFYCNHYYENVADTGMRVLQLFIATILCISALSITPTTMGGLTDVGRYTLIIYLLHRPMIKVMNMVCGHAGIEQNPLVAIVMTIIIVVFIYSIRNLKVFKYLR